jgi:CDP-diacylglycerol--glycerol-3-phosphate 3-phosphatidyltransferase
MSRSNISPWPNRVSIARALLVVPFVMCLLNLDRVEGPWLRYLALGVFGVLALSDALDGYLARRLQAVSTLGKFLDPLGDKLLILSAVVVLGVVGVPAGPRHDAERLFIPNWVVVVTISKDLGVLLGFVLVYFVTGRLYTEVRRLGKWCTTFQLLMVLSVLVWPDLPAALHPLPAALWWSATVLAAAALLDYVRLGYRFIAATASESPKEPL